MFMTSDGKCARTVLVTGGSAGIGAEIVRALAGRGHQVACGYYSGADRVDDLIARFGQNVRAVRYELGSAESAEAAVRGTVSAWGRLDALVLNAGIWAGGRLEAVDAGVWWSVVERNVAGVAQLCRAALPHLRRGDSPSITLVSSVVGLVGYPGDTAYASAKAALIGFARALAKEAGADGIRVNVLAPGFVDTAMTRRIPDAIRGRINDRSVLGRFGTAQEVAAAAVFLCDEATFCTGSVLTTDGGWSL